MAIQKRRRFWASLVLSLLTPGLGQLYNGHIKKASILYLVNILTVFSMTTLFSSIYGHMGRLFWGPLFWTIIGASLYVFAIVDAIYHSIKLKKFSLTRYNCWSVYVLIITINIGLNIVMNSSLWARPTAVLSNVYTSYRTVTTRLFPYFPKLEKKSQTTVTKWTGSRYFGEYKLRNVEQLDELPGNVRENVMSHLIDRLGEDFYRTLHFTWGEIVDKEQLLREQPNAKDYKWDVHTYDLHFMFSRLDKGIEAYYAQIKLDETGHVMEEIDLPHIARDQSKSQLISLQEAKEIAAKNAFKVEYTDIEIDYQQQHDVIIWRFRQLIRDDGLSMTFKNIEINAHTSEILSTYKTEAIR
jgi:uncharacterized membrane protein YkoI/TM2 domain-containing membrane protein YozV